MEPRKLLALFISFLSVEATVVAPGSATPEAKKQNVAPVADQAAFENDLMSIDDVLHLPDLSASQKNEISKIQQKFKSLIHPMKEEMLALKSQVSPKNKHKRIAGTEPGSEIGGAIMAGLIKVERPDSSDKSKLEAEPTAESEVDKATNDSVFQKDRELKKRAKLIKQKIKQLKRDAWSQIMNQLTPAQRSRLSN